MACNEHHMVRIDTRLTDGWTYLRAINGFQIVQYRCHADEFYSKRAACGFTIGRCWEVDDWIVGLGRCFRGRAIMVANERPLKECVTIGFSGDKLG
jgi:hypothetical protein